jgi:hypothetical protein
MDTDISDTIARIASFPQLASPRHALDVPQDVDFFKDHLNDPNFDLRNRSKSGIASSATIELKRRRSDESSWNHDFSSKFADFDDSESQIESTRFSTTTRMSDFTDFDEYVESPKYYQMHWLTILQRISLPRSACFGSQR